MTKNISMQLIEYWVARVIEVYGDDCKRVIKEVKFPTEPTEADIVQILLETDRENFVTVSHNYKLGNITTKATEKEERCKYGVYMQGVVDNG